jgi:hypothetical protein
VKLLGSVEDSFTLTTKTVLTTIRKSDDAARVDDKIQLRSSVGHAVDCEILGIELIKKIEGRCHEAYMVREHFPKTKIPVGTEIWLL